MNEAGNASLEAGGSGSVFNDSPSMSAKCFNQVRAGQVLKPTLSPGKKNLQWILQDIDGQERPISFGRAPPPPPPPGTFSDGSPAISPTSDDTSPFKTPQGHHAWTIGASFTSRPYGWKGGDGQEISFSGYGPQTEYNPMSPVNMMFFPSNHSSPLQQPHGSNSPGNQYQSPKVWPRSQKQWAELAGYNNVATKVPCGNMEFVSAVEHMPMWAPESAMGYCNDCAPR